MARADGAAAQRGADAPAGASSAAEAEKVFAAEAAIAGVRVAVIVLNSLVYGLLMPKGGTLEWLAYAVVVAANLYGIGVLALQPYRRFPVMLSSYFTTLLDAAFISIWLFATGGFESPFYLLWMLSVTAVAFRFDLRATLLAATLYSVCYLGIVVLDGGIATHAADVIVRTGYIFLVALLGGLLSRELLAQTKAKVELQELTARLREQEERFRRLSDATFEGIAIHDQGRILEANASFARMFGYGPGEALGLQASVLVDPVSQPDVAARIQAPTDEPYDIVARRKDGSTFHAEITARDFPYEGRNVRVVAVRDVTERKKAERAIRAAVDLEVQNERLREIDALKSKFINSAAHELGTPLTPIKLQAHLLKLGGFGELNDKQRRAVDVLSRNVDHLGLMVKDLLDASRLQSGDMEIKRGEVDLGALLGEAVEPFAADPEVSIALVADADLRVEADGARLKQVALNLLGNARKFTPPGGRIEVRAAREGDQVHVEVTDSGAGIEAADVAKLFRPFSQVHDTNATSRAGAGLGLYISRGIVESHGGRIWVTSPGRGRGATFHVLLPVRASRGVVVQRG